MQPKHPTLCRRAWSGGGRRDFPPDGPHFRLSMLLVDSLLRSLCPKTYTFNKFRDVLCSQNQTPFWARVAFSVQQNIHFQLIPCCFVSLPFLAPSGKGQARFSGRRSTFLMPTVFHEHFLYNVSRLVCWHPPGTIFCTTVHASLRTMVLKSFRPTVCISHADCSLLWDWPGMCPN